MKSFDTPILFLIFNRPDTTARVFEEIRKVRPAKLFIAADGPRLQVPADKAKCAETRSVVGKINWPCEVKTLFRDENLGCKAAVGGAINWFFSSVEEGIILEDDCLPDQSFFPFCVDMLKRYRDNSDVMLVSGSNLVAETNKSKNSSYFYSKYANIWGWSTWKRAWQKYDGNMTGFKDPAQQDKIRQHIASDWQWKTKKWSFGQVYAGRKNSWAYAWEYAVLKNEGVSIVPIINLIQNIGFDRGATHTGSNSKGLNVSASAMPFPLMYNDLPEPNAKYDNAFMKKAFGNPNSPVRFVKRTTNFIMRAVSKAARKTRASSALVKRIHIIRPNTLHPHYHYLVKGDAKMLNTVVDVGCGFDADFSTYMVKNYGLKAFGVDPTRKHKEALEKIADDLKGKFTYVPLAISSTDGSLQFNESIDNVSGSILKEHRNVRDGATISYTVESSSLCGLPKRLGLAKIDYIKLDLEGAEYDLLKAVSTENLKDYSQLFIEFHHHAIPSYTKADTAQSVKKLESYGFKSFTLNGNDYLFYRS